MSLKFGADTTKLYRGTPPEENGALPTKLGVHSLAFGPDGKTLVTATGTQYGLVQIWDVPTLKERLKLEGILFVRNALAISPNGKTLAIGDLGEGDAPAPIFVRLYDLETGKQWTSFRVKGTHVEHLAFFPDGKTLMVDASYSGGVELWSVEKDPPQQVAKLPRETGGSSDSGFALSADGKLMATSRSVKGSDNYGELSIWEIPAGKLRMKWRVDRTFFSALALSPDGKLVLAGGHTKSGDGAVKLWKLPE